MRGSITLSLALFASASMAKTILEPSNQVILDNHNDMAALLKAEGVDPEEKRVLEFGPGKIKVVTEAEKWQLKKTGERFMDITNHRDFGTGIRSKKTYKYPNKPQHQEIVKPLLDQLTTEHMKHNLEKFTSFHTRYFKSVTGRQSGEWLLAEVANTASYNKNINVTHFEHDWAQSSVIARIPPSAVSNVTDDDGDDKPRVSKTNVVIGAHQDSVNMFFPYWRSPGADDDGSGTVTILEAFRVLSSNQVPLKNPVEFHWYSAEEGGLLGSQDIFQDYQERNVLVGAMLQQDMTGYVGKNTEESVGVIVDYVDPELTRFIKTVIEEYCDVPWVETKCGYACSDHASASKAGYPSAFVIESEFSDSNKHIHTTDDQIKHLSFEHMLQHARLTLALAVELGLAPLEDQKYD